MTDYLFKMFMFKLIILFLFIACSKQCPASMLSTEKTSKRVCIIGAGIAGLSTARYLKEEGIDFTVLEVTKYIGGTWRYDPRTGNDENGIPLHTSMYKHLRTNLPKPTMELKGFPIPDDVPSFPSWNIYYNYLQNYTRHFDLEKHIKFLHNVVLVKREGNVWKVKHEHVKTGQIFEEEYDFVVVGTGHYNKPNMPNTPGENIFKGSIIHSHDYRVPEPYKNRRVLLVGAGPSGMDIAMDVGAVTKTLIHSHHSKVNFKTTLPPHYVHKPDIRKLTKHGVIFVDGTYEHVDDIIYCTGYNYDFSFLDETSGLTIQPRTVVPLYQNMVNINQPSMVILGIVTMVNFVVCLDAQARYTSAMIKGNFILPSREEMMQVWQKEANAAHSAHLAGLPRSFSSTHALFKRENEYYAALSKESGIERVPHVLYKIRADTIRNMFRNFYTFRNYAYTVEDDGSFTKVLEVPPLKNHSLAPLTYRG